MQPAVYYVVQTSREDPMSAPGLDEQQLAIILRNAGLNLTPDQVRSVLPGAMIVRGMIERVRKPLPREAEPASVFKPEQG
jgi:hypothetical protein